MNIISLSELKSRLKKSYHWSRKRVFLSPLYLVLLHVLAKFQFPVNLAMKHCFKVEPHFISIKVECFPTVFLQSTPGNDTARDIDIYLTQISIFDCVQIFDYVYSALYF